MAVVRNDMPGLGGLQSAQPLTGDEPVLKGVNSWIIVNRRDIYLTAMKSRQYISATYQFASQMTDTQRSEFMTRCERLSDSVHRRYGDDMVEMLLPQLFRALCRTAYIILIRGRRSERPPREWEKTDD